tara:strand:+ start:781 stop:996 length:216 start_codon:yes stop_codon:yes gene_type:complete
MNSITKLLKEMKNLFPYFILIAIYFFFVNLEARKENKSNINYKKENIILNDSSSTSVGNFRMKIPVIPYNE